MTDRPLPSATGRTPPEMSALLAIVRDMVGQVHPKWRNLHFTPDTHLERELGLDSIARSELHVRIEQALDIALADGAGVCAATPGDLMRAVRAAFADDGGYRPCPQPNGSNAAADLLMGDFGNPAAAATSGTGHSLGEWLYAIYTWPVFTVLALLAWVLVVCTPFEHGRRKLAHWCARMLMYCTFTPLEVSGHEHLDPDRAQIIVANHASYLDGFIVTAALDVPIHFIVKGELARNLPVRLILQRFGVEFVDRFNANKGSSDVARIANKSRNGQSIVFFPEGTFTTFAGLQPFRMGAFVTAARARVPVVPVAISGARDMVRGDDWFPRRGRLKVTICPPIEPQGEGWQVALDLRDAARHEIAKYCGEPDLVGE
ncbi:MAG: 1-acyl-sn-glycerol-3-phosphate acyltransferase [Pseudomonadota bacterium]